MPILAMSGTKPPRPGERHRKSCGTVIAERKNKLENVTLDVKVRYLEKERIRSKHDTKRGKKDLMKFIRLMKTTTGKHPDGIISDAYDKQVCESEHFRFGYIINDKRLGQWRGKEKLFDRQMGDLEMDDKIDILDGCIALQQLIEEIRVENDPNRTRDERPKSSNPRPQSSASSSKSSSKVDVFESLRREPDLPSDTSASCPPEFSVRAWEENILNNYISRAREDPRVLTAKTQVRPWSAFDLGRTNTSKFDLGRTNTGQKTKKVVKNTQQTIEEYKSYPNGKIRPASSSGTRKSSFVNATRSRPASAAIRDDSKTLRRNGVVMRPASAMSNPVSIHSTSLLKELTDLAAAEDESDFEQVVIADEQFESSSDLAHQPSESEDRVLSTMKNNFFGEVPNDDTSKKCDINEDLINPTDGIEKVNVNRRKPSIKSSPDLRSKSPPGTYKNRRQSRDFNGESRRTSLVSSASSKKVAFKSQQVVAHKTQKHPVKTIPRVPLPLTTIDLAMNKGPLRLDEDGNIKKRTPGVGMGFDDIDHGESQVPQWRRDLLAEAPPGLYSTAEKPSVRLAMSKSARRRELEKMVNENLTSQIDDLIITEKERQRNARTALQRSMQQLQSVTVTDF